MLRFAIPLISIMVALTSMTAWAGGTLNPGNYDYRNNDRARSSDFGVRNGPTVRSGDFDYRNRRRGERVRSTDSNDRYDGINRRELREWQRREVLRDIARDRYLRDRYSAGNRWDYRRDRDSHYRPRPDTGRSIIVIPQLIFRSR